MKTEVGNVAMGMVETEVGTMAYEVEAQGAEVQVVVWVVVLAEEGSNGGGGGGGGWGWGVVAKVVVVGMGVRCLEARRGGLLAEQEEVGPALVALVVEVVGEGA
ncbi:hypothetical protein CYMTET_35113 [Cymbomonas tetramitiformis]|uniref:Uncharacterized protein n=1 Tax=Cymbomonas tetramitiformis TaxID=36881 RepID=A0AAE0F9S8_9CHLO|nr:hypothetical protein CYMTET_35113 [Cymbomonas tetramitiformis]